MCRGCYFLQREDKPETGVRNEDTRDKNPAAISNPIFPEKTNDSENPPEITTPPQLFSDEKQPSSLVNQVPDELFDLPPHSAPEGNPTDYTTTTNGLAYLPRENPPEITTPAQNQPSSLVNQVPEEMFDPMLHLAPGNVTDYTVDTHKLEDNQNSTQEPQSSPKSERLVYPFM